MITYPLNEILYDASDAELFHCTRNSGVYADTDFQPTVTGADNIVTIGAGIGWIRNSKFSGKVIAEKKSTSVNMGVADASLPRIDVVCIRFDSNANETKIVSKQGVPASSPIIPTISRTETLYELYLCRVYRPAGATTITSANVTDLRLDPVYCGLMADSVTEIDTTGIKAQINALIEELREEIAEVKSSAEIMIKSVYDADNDGVVDNAGRLGGQLPNYYATATAVSTAQNTATNAQSTANTANATANAAMPKSGGTFTGAVTHNASTNFNASTYMKNGVGYNAYDSNGNACVLMALSSSNHLTVGSSSYPHSGNTVVLAKNGYAINTSGGFNAYITVNGAAYGDNVHQVLKWGRLSASSSEAASYLRCGTTDTSYLGTSSYKWAAVYAKNGAIQTSDRNLKKNIKDLDDRYIQLFDLVRPVSYQMIDGDRIHTGFIAQEVEEAMAKVGLTAEDVGFFCKDIKTTIVDEDIGEVPVLDENGNPVYTYSLRYEEYIAITAEKVRRLENRINLLETAIEKLTKYGEE